MHATCIYIGKCHRKSHNIKISHSMSNPFCQGISRPIIHWIVNPFQITARRPNRVIPYTSPCILIILYILYTYAHIYAYVHRKPQGSTGRKWKMVMAGLQNPAKEKCFSTLLAPVHRTFYIRILCAHVPRQSQESTERKCNMVMGGFPNPAKTQCFSTLAPASYILHRRTRLANRRDQQSESITWSWEVSQSLQKHSVSLP